MVAEGLITLPSSYGPQETVNRLVAEIKARGMTILPISIMPPEPPRLGCRCGPPSW